MKKCVTCKVFSEDAINYSTGPTGIKFYHCKPCHNARLNRYRSIPKNREKHNARQRVFNALRDGRLNKESCEVCGEENSQAHHEDYSKPLEVKWLCRKHHMAVHYS